MVWGSVMAYKLAAVALILLTPVTFYFFLSAFFKNEFSALQKLIGALAFTLLYFGLMPDIAEGIYWYTGAMTYVLANLLTLVYISFVAMYLQKRYIINRFIHGLKCIALLFIVIGFNEVNTLILIAGHAIVLMAIRKEKSLRPALFILSVLTTLFALIMILAPGNAQRGSYFTENYHMLHSLGMSVLQVARFFVKWVAFPPLLLASVLFIPIGQKLYGQSAFFRQLCGIKLWQVFLMLCGIIFLCVFPAYWGTGILGQHRTLNTASFFFIPVWFLFVFIAAKQFGATNYAIAVPVKMQHMLVLIFMACLLFSGNSGSAIIELGSGEAYKYTAEMDARTTLLENAKAQNLKKLIMPSIKNRPACLFVLDASADPGNGINTSYAVYYGINTIETDNTK